MGRALGPRVFRKFWWSNVKQTPFVSRNTTNILHPWSGCVGQWCRLDRRDSWMIWIYPIFWFCFCLAMFYWSLQGKGEHVPSKMNLSWCLLWECPPTRFVSGEWCQFPKAKDVFVDALGLSWRPFGTRRAMGCERGVIQCIFSWVPGGALFKTASCFLFEFYRWWNISIIPDTICNLI